MTINDRLNKIIERENLTVASFARKIDIGDQTVRSVCVMKRNKPSFEFLSKVVQTFDWLDPRWLLIGEGSMERSENEKMDNRASGGRPSRDIVEIIKYMREKDVYFDRSIREKDKQIQDLIAESTMWRTRFENKDALSVANTQIYNVR